MTTSFLWLLGYVVAAPILVAGIRFPSPKPQLQEDWQPAAVAAHKTWTLSRLDVRDILSNNKSTGGRHHRHLATSFSMSNYNSSVNECILLFGAFCNGNLGDVIQPTAMENLLALAAPEQCFWYAHPFEEELDRGNHIGELFSDKISGDRSRLIHLTPEHAEEVNQFKALIIGGGGIFASKHPPLDAESFAEGLTLPIIVLGVGANRYRSKRYATLLEKSSFVSGRDAPSIDALSSVLRESKDPTTQADSVAMVRDPVLSNKMFSDVEGKCWKQSEGENGQPLCFILPASNSQATVEMHRHLVSHVVRPGDVFVNVFPKHQKEILEQHDYPGEILQVLDPAEFTERLCSCRAIVSTRFHGVILGLHMGVPTLGASGTSHGNKVPEVLIDTMRLPEQYLLINEGLTRRAVDLEVNVVREMYARHGRRATIHARLAALHDDFKAQARHVLFNVVGVRERPRQGGGGFEPGENLGGREKHQENDAGASGVAELSPADLATKGSAAFGRLSNSGVPFAGGGDTATRVDADTAAAANAIGMGSKMAEEWQPSTEKAEEAAEEEQAAATARRSPIVAPVKDVTTAAAAAAAVSTTPKRPKKEEPLNAVAASFPPLEEVSGGSLLASALLDNNVLSARSTEEREEGGDPEPLPSSKTAYFGETGAGPAGISTEGDEYSNAGVYVSGGNLFKTRVAAEEHQKGRDGVPVGVASADGNRHRGAEAAERVAAITRASASAAAGDIDPVLTGEGVSTNVEVESAVVNHEYVVAILLIAAIVALALLPSGGAARQPSCSSDTVKEARECGKKTNPHIHGDAESDSSGLSAVRSARPAGATPGAAATSSKMIFMLNFMVWVSLAMGFSGYGKAYLRETQDPIGLLVLQGGIGAVVLCLLGHFGVLDLHPGKDLTPAAAQQAGLAAFLHTIQALLTNFAVFVGGVAVTNALKALEPVAAAAFSYFLLGKPCSGPRMAALATIVVGIIVLTFRNNDRGGGSDDVFSSAAFAMSAVACNALRNVVIKKGRPIPPHQTLFACSAAATAVGVALMLLRHARLHLGDLLAESGRSGGDVASEGGDTEIAGHHDLTTSWLRMDGINAALCFVGYNLASFNLLARLSPVGHAVGNSCKRVLVFASGLLFLGEVMSVRQLGGAAVALFGVLAYNIAGTR